MFFRREKPHVPSFEERQQALRKSGFSIAAEGGGRVRVERDGCAAIIEDAGNGLVKVDKAGVLLGGEIGMVVHGGYQMFLRTPGGSMQPALAGHLKTLHAFEEDLREALGIVSLYNVGLGSTCDRHMYDRLEHRDEVGQAILSPANRHSCK